MGGWVWVDGEGGWRVEDLTGGVEDVGGLDGVQLRKDGLAILEAGLGGRHGLALYGGGGSERVGGWVEGRKEGREAFASPPTEHTTHTFMGKDSTNPCPTRRTYLRLEHLNELPANPAVLAKHEVLLLDVGWGGMGG